MQRTNFWLNIESSFIEITKAKTTQHTLKMIY